MPKIGGLGQFADLRGVGDDKGGGVFEGGVNTPMHTMLYFSLAAKFFL